MVSPPQIIVQLIHLEGPYKGQIQEFTDNEISIGRNPDCTLKFPSSVSIISRKHASIFREGNRFKLVDLSANGTEVNGKKVKEAYLKSGDVLTIAPGGPKISFLTEISSQQINQASISAGQKPAAPHPPPEEKFQSPPPVQPRQQPPASAQPKRQAPQAQGPIAAAPPPDERVMAQLFIQLGPTLRNYKELPVTIGRNPNCEFILDLPGILDRHAQILFSQNHYQIKDLTGQKLVSVNHAPCEGAVVLQADDVVKLSPQGPVLQFLGGGRLAEMEQQQPEVAPEPPPESQISRTPKPQESLSDEVLNKAKSIFRKYLKS